MEFPNQDQEKIFMVFFSFDGLTTITLLCGTKDVQQ